MRIGFSITSQTKKGKKDPEFQKKPELALKLIEKRNYW
jgi:hypothetical protein